MFNILTVPLGLAVADSMGPVIGLWPSVLGFGTYQIAFVFMCMGLSVGVYGSFVVSKVGMIEIITDCYSTTSSPPFATISTFGV